MSDADDVGVTLVGLLAELRADGFTEDVQVGDDGALTFGSCGHRVAAEDVELLELRRIEGSSDPGDEAAVLGLRCHSCGSLGVAIVRYGPEAGPGDVIVLQHIDDRRRGQS